LPPTTFKLQNESDEILPPSPTAHLEPETVQNRIETAGNGSGLELDRELDLCRKRKWIETEVKRLFLANTIWHFFRGKCVFCSI
jgi:hypothetical protein